MTIIAETEREGIWQCGRPALANCKAARTFPQSHRPSDSFMCNHIFLFFFFYQCVSTPKPPPPPPPSTSPASVRLCVCLKWIFYLAVKSSSVIYNSRPITLFPPTHGENESKSLPFHSRVNSSPAPPVIRIFCSKYQRKRFGDCVSCVLSSVSLN